MFDRLYFSSWLSLGAVCLFVGGCADDVAVTVSESSSGTTQGSTSTMETTGSPTTPTTGGDPTTSTSTSTGDASTSTGAVTDTDTDTDALTSGSTSSTGSTGEPATSTTGSTGEPDTSSSTGGDTDTGVDCVPGELNCECLAGECAPGGLCLLEKCLPFSGQCDFEFDFECDEGVLCEPGTDPFDCCATPQDGICEEAGMGGECSVYSDYYDCNYCIFTNDFECDEPTYCPVGTDEQDCCATQQNGVCEEISMGGVCPDGSDSFDCGGCAFQNDGFCDEPDFCPPGSDSADCCATIEDGVCEEMQFGGMCEDGSDSYDCGYCLSENDGFCDVPFFCPEGSDSADCCATSQDGVCEEMQFGGVCEDGTDHFDCGYCIDENDGFCDEPDFCPVGTDVADCCATEQDGVCEEMQFGGQCADGSDHFDCGYCIDENDGICDEPFFCPEGTDDADCCITNDDGVCDELALGGTCPEGQDFYDCGYCPFEDDNECDVPFICPEGSDVNDCG